MKRSALQFICIVCLLFAQQAAFTHALWHTHEPSVRSHTGHDRPSAQGDLCKLHGLFSQVLGTAPGTTFHVAIGNALNEQSAHLSPPVPSSSPLRPRSRGPPRLS
jgi:hypothetical protein